MRPIQFALSLAVFCAGIALCGDAPAPVAPALPAQTPQKLSAQDVRALIAPIALYPDGILAQVLPASTFPLQVIDAYRYTQTAADPKTPPADTHWDSSVVALLQYPTVLKKMNDDLTWLERLGTAVTYQMDDVSQAIQQYRTDTTAAGNLKSNARQNVSTQGQTVSIAPTDPGVVYVPSYDPGLMTQPYADPDALYDYGIGYPIGFGFINDFDWLNRRIWCHRFWDHGRWRDGDRFLFHPQLTSVAHWHSDIRSQATGIARATAAPGFAQSAALGSAAQSRMNFITAGSHTRTWDANETAARENVASNEASRPAFRSAAPNRNVSSSPSYHTGIAHAQASQSYTHPGYSRWPNSFSYAPNSYGSYLRGFAGSRSSHSSSRSSSHHR